MANPNFGNGAKVKKRWAEGRYAERPLAKFTKGKGGHYRGVWFRSSWEISFAKFLDAAEILWLYEPKRFHLKDGKHYSPDFYLPTTETYIEIKGIWWPHAVR